MSLAAYGWTAELDAALRALERESLETARVFRATADFFRVHGEDFEAEAKLSGKIRHDADNAAELPTVGDWVAARRGADGTARIEALLPRRSALTRKVAGRRTAPQVVAANVDLVLVVMGLDGDYNARRLERYLTAVWESGARPAVLLNKADLCASTEERLDEIRGVAVGVEVAAASCKQGRGVETVRAWIAARETAVLVGSSGVGKSTLINRLLGEAVQATREVREGDDRGRHTTTHRELFLLPEGGLLIDSPGIRELQLWAEGESLDQAFEDIVELAAGCRFRDCRHDAEGDCAVRAAVESGELAADRLASFRTLQKELQHLETRQSESAQREQKRKWKTIHKEYRRFTKKRGR